MNNFESSEHAFDADGVSETATLVQLSGGMVL
jgi:hypothetical protein